MKNFRCDIAGVNESRWSNNGLTYETEEEAKNYLNGLSQRWFGYDLSRIVPAETLRNEPVNLDDPLIYQNFRK